MIEMEGNVLHNDYKLRKLTQSLRDKDNQIAALKSRIEEITLKAETEIQKKEKIIEKLTRSNNQYRGFKRSTKPRESTLVETKAESPGDALSAA